MRLADASDRLETSDAWHDEVDDDDVGRVLRGHVDRAFARRRFGDHRDVVECREAGAHALTEQVMVVGDDDGDHGRDHGGR